MSVIEKCARAICDTRIKVNGKSDSDKSWRLFKRDAKAVLSTLAADLDEGALGAAQKEGAGTWHNITGKDSLNITIKAAIQAYLAALTDNKREI